MSQIWMDVDTALIEIPVNVNPLVDAATAKVVDEGVTFDEAGIDVNWHFTTTGGVSTSTPVTPTSGGDYNWQHQDGGMYTIAMPASAGASVNNDSTGFGYFTGNTTANLPWRGPTIGFRITRMNAAMVDGSFVDPNARVDVGLWLGTAVTLSASLPDVNIEALEGVTATLASLANQYDGVTGLSGSTFPARQDQVNNIGSGATGGTHVEATYDNTTQDTIDNAAANLLGGGLVGIPVTGHAFVAGREVTIAGSTAYNGAFEVISQTANEVVITHTQTAEAFTGAETIVSSIKGEVFVGTITLGTFADTAAAQGDLHSMIDDGDVISIVYGFNVGGSRQATDIAVFANVNGNTDEIIVKAYNFVSQAFEDKATLPGSGGTAFIPLDPALLARNTGTGTEIGDVFILFDTVTTTPSSLDVDECLITAVGTNTLIGYPNGFEISAAGTSGTEFGVNGTAGNPCPFADALTMNAVTPLNLFTIQNGESITLAASADNLTLQGVAWTLSLSVGGQSIAGALFDGAHVTGIGTSAGEEGHFTNCKMGACTIPPSFLSSCGVGEDSGTLAGGSAGEYIFDNCYSMAPGSATPTLTFTGLGSATGINNRGWKGGATWNVDSDITLSHCVLVGGGTTFNTSGADIEVRGIIRSLTCAFTAGGTTPTVQFAGITGPVTLSGTAAAGTTVNLYGVSSSLADTSSNTTVTDATTSRTNYIGGDYALDTDANGRLRIVDGTGTGEIDTSSGTVKITDGTITTSTFAAGAINAAAIGADAITNAKIADDAFASEQFATGAFTADAFSADALIAATFATGAFTADVFAADALVAATFATDSISADALAADAVDEIADGVLDEVNTAATHNVPASVGRQIRQISSNVLGPFTVASATANTITLDADGDLSEVDGSYDPARIFVDSGTGADQTGQIVEYFGGAGNGNGARTLIMREDMKVTLASDSAIFILVSDGRTSTNQGQLRGGSTTTATLNALAPGADVSGQTLHFTGGTGQDQVALIESYSSPIATFQTIDVAVNATTSYELLPIGCVNVEQINNDAQSATDLKDFVDAGYDPVTNKVQGVVLVDTTTALATDAVDADALAADAAAEIAAQVLIQSVEGAAEDHANTVAVKTVAALILALRHADTTTNAGFLTIFKVDGTELAQLALASDDTADPITGVGS